MVPFSALRDSRRPLLHPQPLCRKSLPEHGIWLNERIHSAGVGGIGVAPALRLPRDKSAVPGSPISEIALRAKPILEQRRPHLKCRIPIAKTTTMAAVPE